MKNDFIEQRNQKQKRLLFGFDTYGIRVNVYRHSRPNIEATLLQTAQHTLLQMITLPSSTVYEGEWKDGNMHGKGKITWASGNVYEGECKDDLLIAYIS